MSLADFIARSASQLASHTVLLQPSAYAEDAPHSIRLNLLSSDPAYQLQKLGKDSQDGFVACLATPTNALVASLIPHIREIVQLPIVFHFATNGDYSPIQALRSAGFIIIYSASAEEAQVHAVLSARLAKEQKQAVIHLFEEQPTSIPSLSPNKAAQFLKNKPYTNGTNGHHTTANEASPASTDEAFAAAASTFATPIRPYTLTGTSNPSSLLIVVGTSANIAPIVNSLPTDTALLTLTLIKPLSPAHLVSLIPESVGTIGVLEQHYASGAAWTPLYLDVLLALNQAAADGRKMPKVYSAVLGTGSTPDEVTQLLRGDLLSGNIGQLPSSPVASTPAPVKVPKHEESYTLLLEQIFAERLNIANSPNKAFVSTSSTILPHSPEYALGSLLKQSADRASFKKVAQDLLASNELADYPQLAQVLATWTKKSFDPATAQALESTLASHSVSSSKIKELRSLTSSLHRNSPWIIGSESWSHDLGSSGVHHALSSGVDVNMLIIDTTPYSLESAANPDKRKKDIGLYAMNYGNAYVASVAVYGDYSQVARALVEADKFEGPSIVLAYLPNGEKDQMRALEILQETKRAIDSGYWPLYRWNPIKPDDQQFQLDSERIKADLSAFLNRQNHLTQLASRQPTFSDNLSGSLGKKRLDASQQKAFDAFEKLSGAVDGPPLLILYASDGGNAEKFAKRLLSRAKTRGLGARLIVMDDFQPDDLALEQNVVFVTSTAGQGEFPQNARIFWKALQNVVVAPNSPEGSIGFDQCRYTVFGMGDSHYWPRPEDAHYYNKPAKDLDKRLKNLGAAELTEIGLGDDQHADGAQTGYKEWEPRLWKALGVDAVEVIEAEPEPITNEHIKIASNYLRGTIAEGLRDKSTGALAESDGQLTKFHGIYQQDDRDIRDQRKEQGLEPAYSFMVRVRMPAGVCKPEQWLAVDQISDDRGNNTFKLTTRQTFQFHGIIKSNLKPAIQEINRALLDTIAACGDVNRNVLSSANPNLGALHAECHEFAKNLSEHLMPQTSAYAEIWLDKKMVAGDALQDVEPLYGAYYLPRKFKIAIAVPPQNDTDVFCNDVGFIAITDDSRKKLLGFNVSIGGGMGVTHSNKKTYPRVGTIIGFVTPDKGVDVAEKIMLVQRDNGDRTNRKHARLKYTVDDMTVEGFKAEVEKRLGYQLDAARAFEFTRNVDDFGWQTGEDGRHHFTCFIENGRVQDEPGKPFKTGLREIAKVLNGNFRLTANQHVIISDIPTEDKPLIESLLKKYKLDNVNFSGLRLSSSACVAFPTCGLAMAESERYLPILIDKIEKICEDAGLRNDSIVMRMSGCPNGCSRPWVAEVAFVGRAPGAYLMTLGGGYHGDRVAKPYKESVGEAEIIEILTPMIHRYAKERLDNEKFGDFVIRAGYITATAEGKNFYDNSVLA